MRAAAASVRLPGTRADGTPFDEVTIHQVWRKARDCGFGPFRKDACGARISFVEYGATSDDGWEIDHIRPVALGGADDLDNLQPLQWRANRRQGNSYPWVGTVADTDAMI